VHHDVGLVRGLLRLCLVQPEGFFRLEHRTTPGVAPLVEGRIEKGGSDTAGTLRKGC
jgi:hypothetical protein